MGRIKTQMIKRLTHELIDRHAEKFSEDFTQNKELVGASISGASKKMRNVIAGYVTRLVRMKRVKEE